MMEKLIVMVMLKMKMAMVRRDGRRSIVALLFESAEFEPGSRDSRSRRKSP
jgi:hypothetical protein